MGLTQKVAATAKDIEGKIQEQLGKVIGNEQSELAGKAKQAEAGGEHNTDQVACDTQSFASR
ncbi:CsbD family protein [Synechococcus sp. CS-602]|nr:MULTISPECIES: hypothetical protein [unclassified Synechococcus]MCT0202811.1 CsbD family protein [Synechococcus sp. CS-603]MCT0204801.1 CsbD family protein [Synechococcus sp. CS-602]MCT0245037.1 CsbD family protein [Synechococcus sp. CS-601]MCT4364674.1 CsbD family protein [Candidatus Regnicoccus frigidus MAG-AL1]MCT4368030.1 CsbD family protein [Candidatus Regnicoccus frigidus MAG-AL2]